MKTKATIIYLLLQIIHVFVQLLYIYISFGLKPSSRYQIVCFLTFLDLMFLWEGFFKIIVRNKKNGKD